jgi:hypothetical protein
MLPDVFFSRNKNELRLARYILSCFALRVRAVSIAMYKPALDLTTTLLSIEHRAWG